MSIFKACDIRGKYGEELTDDIAFRIGRATATLFKSKYFVVGGDLRPSTLKLKPALIDGLLLSGASVIDIGIVPTPVFYFALKHLEIECGVQITGSHNPVSDNGMKIVPGKYPITPEEIKGIEKLVKSEKFIDGKGMVFTQDVIQKYKNT